MRTSSCRRCASNCAVITKNQWSCKMAAALSDAIVFFGASGDLAYKQIFPALRGLVCDEGIEVPIFGVARSGWDLDTLKARARDSLERHGSHDPEAFEKFAGL